MKVATRLLIAFILGALLSGSMAAVGRPAQAASPTALILSTTVTDSGGPGTSIEQTYLQSQGYAVTEVDPTTWSGMTATQFSSYQLIVFGDPTCGSDPSVLDAAVTNESTWAPVVNGNIIVIGTDPVYHYTGGVSGALTLIQKGLDFAGGQSGKTGLYLDLSCYYNNGLSAQDAPILDGIESGFQLTSPGCFDTIDVVATNPLIAGLTNADLSDWGCSVHEYANAWPADFIPIAIDTTASPPLYTAPDGSTGDPYILGRGAGLAAGGISLTPASGSQTVGSNYTLTASVQSGGSPVVGTTVTFTDTAGPNVGMTATATTDASGNATETYTSATTGTDTWTASFVDASSHTETSNNATVTWTAPVAAPTTLTVNSATGDFADATNVSAVLTNSNTSAPVPGESVTLTLNGTETCTVATDATGTASCSITPGEAAGPYTLAGSFAGDSSFQPSSGSASFDVTLEQTGLTYTGDTSAINGQPMTLSGVLTTDDPAAGTPLAGMSVSFTLGSGGSAQTCSGTTDPTGTASCTIASVSQTVGSVGVSASFAGDTYYQPASASTSVMVFAPPATGAFVVGDVSAGSPTVGTHVYFWGSQWAKKNRLSGGPAPSSMKGFADSPQALTCGSTWTTTTGNSSAPPASLPGQIEVIISDHITQTGSTISGTVVHIVLVQVDPGYLNDPGHTGTGTILGVIC